MPAAVLIVRVDIGRQSDVPAKVVTGSDTVEKFVVDSPRNTWTRRPGSALAAARFHDLGEPYGGVI
jgi:hypothetical protein